MIKNFKTQSRKEDLKFLTVVLLLFSFVIWLCTPPGNKFAQVCFWGNNTQFFLAKILKKDEVDAYKYYHKNAIYLAKMDKQAESIKAINDAIDNLPTYVSEGVLMDLYVDRAEIKLYFGDQRGALDDLLRVKNRTMTEDFKTALLLKEFGKTQMAQVLCNKILTTSSQAYAGYACYADLYASTGNYNSSVKIMDFIINKFPNRPTYYLDRAYYKNLAGDFRGAHEDEMKAKEISPSSEPIKSIAIVEDTLNPKIIVTKTKC